jgi:hypothetical protein
LTAARAEHVTFEATPVQLRLIDALSDGQSRIIGFGGGIRGTKTWGSLSALITLCKVFPGSRWGIVRKDLQRLRDTTIPSFDKLRARTGGFVGPVNQSNWNATCTNGSVLLFRGENIDKDPELLRFHGYEVNGFLNEEADELSERTLVKEIERAGTWIIPDREEQPPAYILNTFNPCAGWPRRRFFLPWRDHSIAPPYAFIPSTAADNPYISDAQREAWKEMPENEYRRFVLGDWEALTGAYYDTLGVQHLIDRDALPDELPGHWRFWGSFDWGYAHWAVMGAWCTDDQGVDYLLDTVWLRRIADDNELAEEFKKSLPLDCLTQVYAGHDVKAQIKAHSASGETVQQVFARHGILLTLADIDKVNGGRAVNRQLKQNMVKIVRTPGNLRVFDQLGEILPDENDIRKPAKVDADPTTGVGGDDGADMFRYGIATRVNPATLPKRLSLKEANRAIPIETRIVDGHVEVAPPTPRTMDELAERLAAKRTRSHLPVRPRSTHSPKW